MEKLTSGSRKPPPGAGGGGLAVVLGVAVAGAAGRGQGAEGARAVRQHREVAGELAAAVRAGRGGEAVHCLGG